MSLLKWKQMPGEMEILDYIERTALMEDVSRKTWRPADKFVSGERIPMEIDARTVFGLLWTILELERKVGA